MGFNPYNNSDGGNIIRNKLNQGLQVANEAIVPTNSVNSDYVIDITTSFAYGANLILTVAFPTATDDTQDARLSIDNGIAYYNIQNAALTNIKGSEVENKTLIVIATGTVFQLLDTTSEAVEENRNMIIQNGLDIANNTDYIKQVIDANTLDDAVDAAPLSKYGDVIGKYTKDTTFEVLGSDYGAGATSINVADGSIYSIGNQVVIQDDLSDTNYELITITNIITNTLTVSALGKSYTTANNVVLYRSHTGTLPNQYYTVHDIATPIPTDYIMHKSVTKDIGDDQTIEMEVSITNDENEVWAAMEEKTDLGSTADVPQVDGIYQFNGTTSKAQSGTGDAITSVETIVMELQFPQENNETVLGTNANANNVSGIIINASGQLRVSRGGIEDANYTTFPINKTEFKTIILRKTGVFYTAYTNGVAYTPVEQISSTLQDGMTQVSLGARLANDLFGDEQVKLLVITDLAITDQQAKDITNGTIALSTLITAANSEVFFEAKNDSDVSVLENLGTASGYNLTGTDVITPYSQAFKRKTQVFVGASTTPGAIVRVRKKLVNNDGEVKDFGGTYNI